MNLAIAWPTQRDFIDITRRGTIHDRQPEGRRRRRGRGLLDERLRRVRGRRVPRTQCIRGFFPARRPPELQRRGLFHADYTGTTLRENLGLNRPAIGSRVACTRSNPLFVARRRSRRRPRSWFTLPVRSRKKPPMRDQAEQVAMIRPIPVEAGQGPRCSGSPTRATHRPRQGPHEANAIKPLAYSPTSYPQSA